MKCHPNDYFPQSCKNSQAQTYTVAAFSISHNFDDIQLSKSILEHFWMNNVLSIKCKNSTKNGLTVAECVYDCQTHQPQHWMLVVFSNIKPLLKIFWLLSVFKLLNHHKATVTLSIHHAAPSFSAQSEGNVFELLISRHKCINICKTIY